MLHPVQELPVNLVLILLLPVQSEHSALSIAPEHPEQEYLLRNKKFEPQFPQLVVMFVTDRDRYISALMSIILLFKFCTMSALFLLLTIT
jgi:hypothetical protein